MKIELKKFGEILISRPAGKDAYAGFLPILKKVSEGETVIVDCAGIQALSPSWADEFLTPLLEKFKKNFYLTNTQNPSVALTVETLEETNGYKFQIS
jgi:hypothetical protein